MRDEIYVGNLISIPEDDLVHSYKGTEWKKHKYIRKDSAGNYYYHNSRVHGGATDSSRFHGGGSIRMDPPTLEGNTIPDTLRYNHQLWLVEERKRNSDPEYQKYLSEYKRNHAEMHPKNSNTYARELWEFRRDNPNSLGTYLQKGLDWFETHVLTRPRK